MTDGMWGYGRHVNVTKRPPRWRDEHSPDDPVFRPIATMASHDSMGDEVDCEDTHTQRSDFPSYNFVAENSSVSTDENESLSDDVKEKHAPTARRSTIYAIQRQRRLADAARFKNCPPLGQVSEMQEIVDGANTTDSMDLGIKLTDSYTSKDGKLETSCSRMPERNVLAISHRLDEPRILPIQCSFPTPRPLTSSFAYANDVGSNSYCEYPPISAGHMSDSGYETNKTPPTQVTAIPQQPLSQPRPQQQQQQHVNDFLFPAQTSRGRENYWPSPVDMPQTQARCSRSKNSFYINNHSYRILNQIGKGGSSQVYQVYDEKRKQCLAIKCVDLSDSEEYVITAYRNEIALLKRLQKYPDRVISLIDYSYLEDEQKLYVIMEKGDTDLSSLFKRYQQQKFPDHVIAFYWVEMLETVRVIHKEGIVHSDLKPANFLLVAGNLKIIDFGIASAVPSDKTSVTRALPVGTINYMSPEALECAAEESNFRTRVGVKSDVWSLGCMLYNMIYGYTPFHKVHPYRKAAAIKGEDPEHKQIKFAPIANQNLLDVVQRCLERDPQKRPSIDELLSHRYITGTRF